MSDDHDLRPMRSDAEMDRIAYDQAVVANTNAALIMFLARNPGSAHAASARAALAARRTPDAPGAVTGPDARLVSEFDAARLDGDPSALRAFATRHAGHPLAAEALRLAG